MLSILTWDSAAGPARQAPAAPPPATGAVSISSHVMFLLAVDDSVRCGEPRPQRHQGRKRGFRWGGDSPGGAFLAWSRGRRARRALLPQSAQLPPREVLRHGRLAPPELLEVESPSSSGRVKRRAARFSARDLHEVAMKIEVQPAG